MLSCSLKETFSSLPNSHDHFTYAWGSQKSQLDYILLRRAHATGPSKQARVHYTFPLIGIRDGGRHYPVCTQVPMAWQPWQRSRGQPPPPQIDRHAIADALAGTPDASVSAFRTAVQSLMQTPGLTLDAMQHQVHHLAVEHFPARRARLRPPNLVRMSSCRAMQHACGRIFMHTVSFGLWALGRRSPFCFGPGITVPSTIACVPRLRNAVLNFANCVVIGSLLPLGLLLSMATSGNSIRLCVCWRLKDPSVAFSCVRAAHRCRLSEN